MGISEREENEQEIENPFEEMMTKYFPNLVKKKRHINPGGSESPKQVGPKEVHIKTHHN